MRGCLLLLLLGAALAAEDAASGAEAEYVSVPKSLVAGLDIEYFGDVWSERRELEPSDDLRLLLDLDDAEADALEALLLRLRAEFVAEVAALAQVEVGETDHLRFTLRVLQPEVTAIGEALDAGLLEILGPQRKDLLDVVRNDQRFERDHLTHEVFGPLYRRGRDRVSTVEFEAKADGGWRTEYEHRSVALFGGGTSSSSGHHSELPALDRALAGAVLQRHREAAASADPPESAASPP